MKQLYIDNPHFGYYIIILADRLEKRNYKLTLPKINKIAAKFWQKLLTGN